MTLKLQPGILLLIAGAWLPGTVIIGKKKQNWNTALEEFEELPLKSCQQ